MKHNMNRVLSIVALLMLTLGAWALQTVNITVSPQNGGTVTQEIEGSTCTLTVNPAAGYSLANLSAVATLDGSVLQAPKRTLPIDDGVLTVSQVPNDETKYTFTIPEGCNVDVLAEFQAIPCGLTINNQVVTQVNCGNVLGDNEDVHKVTYDASTNTLTLNGANLQTGVVLGESITSLNVALSGANVIEGNGFVFSESPVSLTFTTDVAEPGSLTITGEEAQLVTTSAAQGTTNVYCENGLVYDATAKKVSVPEITLTVGGVSVTSLNALRIVADNISGIVSFDFESNTLTLNNATIDMTNGTGYPIQSNIDDLKVLLIGNNFVKTTNTSDKAFSYSVSNANAKLTFTHEENGFGNLTVTNGNGIAYGYTIVAQEGWTVTANSVSYDTTYGVKIGSTAFTASTLTIGTETANATFNPTTGTLSLNNYTTTDNITSDVADLTILLTGVNSVGTVSYSGTDAGKLTIRKNNDGNELFNELTVTSITNYTVTVVEPLTQAANVYSDARQYNLWINGTKVTSKNMDAIATGVSFDGDHTLTLTNVNTSTDEDPFITNGLNNLTIHLVGTNTVDCGQQLFLTKDGDNNRQVTFTTDPNAAGKLMIRVSEGNNWYTGHTLPTFANDLEERSSVEHTVKTVTIEAPSAYYNLTIAGTQVTNLNASKVVNDNITGGTVSFDVTTNTLTLNGVKISGKIVVNRGALNVYLIGESEIEGFQNDNCDLVFASSSEEGGDKLTMNNDIVVSSGYHVLFRNMLMKTQIGGKYVIALPSDYSITVNGQKITPANRLHVLGANDETVQFDGNNKLILNNANLTSSIELGDMDLLPVINGKKVLTIHLDGTTVMSESKGLVLKFTGTPTDKSDYQVVMDINSNVPGEFVYKYTGSLISIPSSFMAAMGGNLDAVFDGISVKLDDKLNCDLKWNARTLSVSASLTPIIPGSGSNQTDRDFASSKVSTSTLDNVVIDDILYTLNDSHTKGTNDDGFDNGQLVLNSKVSASDLEMAMNYTPGTEDFAKYFKGLTFQVPSGSGIITLNDLFGEPGEFLCVKIGSGEPIKIELTKTPTNYAVEYCVGSATYVYVYLPESSSSAPQMAQRRIGPKSSVAGGLGGLTVKSSSMQAGKSTANTHKEMEKSAMVSSMDAVTNVKDGYTCNDENITSLPDNMFVSSNTQSAARRASGDYYEGTILRKGLTFVDFSKTKITGMEVSRSSGAFKGVPENVFIYVPAGNTTKENNVVIGGICDKLELNGNINAEPFKAMKDFTAGQAVLKREFSAGSATSKATIYLPFAVPQEDADKLGIFYEYVSNDGTTVNMKSVTSGGLKANTPYIFQAKEGGVKDPLVRTVSVMSAPVETDGFKGVYERKGYEDGMYCFVGQEDGKHTIGQFVEMGKDAYVPPFRAYILGKDVAYYAIAWDGVIDNMEDEPDVTAIETAKTVANKKVAEGWWTLNGTRLTQQPKKAGLYICDGKMVVVK